MKNFYENIKDFIYDFIDYIIMIGIVGIVILVIGWRLELLFAKDALDIPDHNTVIVHGNRDYEEDHVEPDPEPEIADPEDSQEATVDEPPIEDIPLDTSPVEGRVVKITVPPGSLPSSIGDILERNGLVASRSEFVEKSQELNLDTKLKSGNFEIKFGSPVEDIVRIIAK
ncbi:MAG: hypothetical protein WCZ27_05650 [Tissierellaceae bacterium]